MAPKAFLRVLLLGLFFATLQVTAATPTPLKVAGWPNYLPLQLLQDFTAATGQGVVYQYQDPLSGSSDSNTSPPDLLFIAAHQLNPLQSSLPLLSLDTSQLPSLELINPGLPGKVYDPQNRYSRILLLRSSGLLLQNDLSPPTQLQELLNPVYRKQLALLQDHREVFALALTALQLPINTSNEQHLQQAHQFLLQLLPNLHSIADAREVQKLLRWNQISIGHLHQGDANPLLRQANRYHFVPLGNNGIQRLDLVVIPATTQQPEAAQQFLAWLVSQQGSSQTATHTGHRSPLLTTQGQAPRSGAWMSQRLADNNNLLLPLPDETEALYSHYWSLFLQSAREAGVHVQN